MAIVLREHVRSEFSSKSTYGKTICKVRGNLSNNVSRLNRAFTNFGVPLDTRLLLKKIWRCKNEESGTYDVQTKKLSAWRLIPSLQGNVLFFILSEHHWNEYICYHKGYIFNLDLYRTYFYNMPVYHKIDPW